MGRKSRNSRSRKARGASKTRQLFKGKARTATKEFLHYLITNPDD
jgi:hypothetical protein